MVERLYLKDVLLKTKFKINETQTEKVKTTSEKTTLQTTQTFVPPTGLFMRSLSILLSKEKTML